VRSEVGSAGVPARKLKGHAIRMRGLALDKRPLSLFIQHVVAGGDARAPDCARRKSCGLQASRPVGRSRRDRRRGFPADGPVRAPSPAHLFCKKTRDRGAPLRRSRRDRPTVGKAGCPRACFARSVWGRGQPRPRQRWVQKACALPTAPQRSAPQKLFTLHSSLFTFLPPFSFLLIPSSLLLSPYYLFPITSYFFPLPHVS